MKGRRFADDDLGGIDGPRIGTVLAGVNEALRLLNVPRNVAPGRSITDREEHAFEP
jgi:hypothetical protein